jgi:hypothetical protein
VPAVRAAGVDSSTTNGVQDAKAVPRKPNQVAECSTSPRMWAGNGDVTNGRVAVHGLALFTEYHFRYQQS